VIASTTSRPLIRGITTSVTRALRIPATLACTVIQAAVLGSLACSSGSGAVDASNDRAAADASRDAAEECEAPITCGPEALGDASCPGLMCLAVCPPGCEQAV
jgi:hypothetical protein